LLARGILWFFCQLRVHSLTTMCMKIKIGTICCSGIPATKPIKGEINPTEWQQQHIFRYLLEAKSFLISWMHDIAWWSTLHTEIALINEIPTPVRIFEISAAQRHALILMSILLAWMPCEEQSFRLKNLKHNGIGRSVDNCMWVGWCELRCNWLGFFIKWVCNGVEYELV